MIATPCDPRAEHGLLASVWHTPATFIGVQPIRSLLLALVLLWPLDAAADFDAGKEAYKRGDSFVRLMPEHGQLMDE